jgi:type II secretion system protein I
VGCHPGARGALIPRASDRPTGGFTLLEVLLALALAALVLGTLLSSAGVQTLRIARIEPRYQALLTAGRVLEKAADQRFRGEESGSGQGLEWKLQTTSVPADPRLEQIRVEVQGTRPGTSVVLTAYRLRARHEDPGERPVESGLDL